ncbi:mitochondrial amidoxime reducing component 2-like [Panonychus citri]|uniref:mitochondrial amidoxime reducing component 2-like n=1 Tax=Panonychus citri TaxID=50023 RepID=UPI002307CA7C|nr:mitochondrial amidoxime reducing component 2-like [Panonychus citri]
MNPNENVIKSVILSGFGLIGVTIIVNQLMKKRLKQFKKVGIVKKLFIYPIKSLKPIQLDSLDYNDQQIYWKSLLDRAFMLVNRKNVMITQRQEPSLVKLIVELDYPYLIVTRPDGSDSIRISILEDDYQNNEEIIETNVWGDDVCGVNCGSEFSQFFSNYLDKPEIRLIRFTNKQKHRPSQLYRDGQLDKDAKIKIMYQDTATCHIINTKSVDTLNEWIENADEKVTYVNFRPNIVVESDSFDEDNWEKIKMGSEQSAEWQQLLKCIRCRITTINPDKGTFMKEPLISLKKYRSPAKEDIGYMDAPGVHGKFIAPLMGVFFKPESSGTIKIDQEIWASHKHGSFWFL